MEGCHPLQGDKPKKTFLITSTSRRQALLSPRAHARVLYIRCSRRRQKSFIYLQNEKNYLSAKDNLRCFIYPRNLFLSAVRQIDFVSSDIFYKFAIAVGLCIGLNRYYFQSTPTYINGVREIIIK